MIAEGRKTVEVRKNKPKIETPFKVYIYQSLHREHNGCTDSDGKVIGEFMCDEILPIRVFENGGIQDYMFHRLERSCVPYDEIANYIGNDKKGYGWHISGLVIYGKPMKLSEFERPCPDNVRSCAMCRQRDYTGMHCNSHIKPPQSWCYVETKGDG